MGSDGYVLFCLVEAPLDRVLLNTRLQAWDRDQDVHPEERRKRMAHFHRPLWITRHWTNAELGVCWKSGRALRNLCPDVNRLSE
jgi:hypothetical protein